MRWQAGDPEELKFQSESEGRKKKKKKKSVSQLEGSQAGGIIFVGADRPLCY